MITQVIEHVAGELRNAGLEVSTSPNDFWPDPVGVLVGIPELVDRTLTGYTLEVPVRVVAAGWLDDGTKEALFDAALDAVDALGEYAFELDGWQTSTNDSELPAYLITHTLSWRRD